MALITTLLMVAVLMTIMGAAMRVAPGALTATAATGDVLYAKLAAEAGVNYARARLAQDLNWRGGADSGPITVVRSPEQMTVVEDRGNVVGLMRFGPGQYGRFRIRFNYQDGSPGLDLLDDPSAEYSLPLPLLSHNNLLLGIPLALKEDNAGLIDRSEQVGPFQLYLAVEGCAGPALREVQMSRPNAPLPSGRRLTTRLVEARLQGRYSQSLDAAAQAAGDLRVSLTESDPDPDERENPKPHQLIVTAGWGKDDLPPRVRAKGQIGVTSPHEGLNFYSPDGHANSGDGTLGPDTVKNSTLTVAPEAPGADFYQLGWDEVDQADADPNSDEAINLDAGTYVVWDDLSLHYYDMSYDKYASNIAANVPMVDKVLSPNLKEARNNLAQFNGNEIELHHTTNPDSSLEVQLLIKRDVRVAPTDETSDFTFITRRGPISGPPDASGVSPGLVDPAARLPGQKIQFQFISSPNQKRTMSVDGEVKLGSRIWGDGGSITATGDIELIGSGSLKSTEVSDGSDGLSLYSQGDIVLNSYKSQWDNLSADYDDLSFNGVIYAWGDIHVQAGPPEGDLTPSSFYGHYGYFRNWGAMVAYGGDPADPVNPGSGKGNIDIRASFARVAYDPNYLPGLDATALPSGFDVVSWLVRD